MDPLRLGVIGLGGMGRVHVKNLRASKLARLVAFADVCEKAARQAADEIKEEDGYDVPVFPDDEKLIDSGLAEAVLIVTPHPTHRDVAVAAFEAGLHVLCEKPLAERISQADRIIEAARKAGTVFAMMFQHRLDGNKRRLRRAIREGTLGRVTRMHMIATRWYRGQDYYDSGKWRGTWAGEGGGVLMNQAPHDLDQVIWQMGAVRSVTARCRTTDVHRIEVEDDAEALLKFESGAVGFFATATCELPGVFRLEINGDRGLISLAEGRLTLRRTNYSIFQFNQGEESARPEKLDATGPAVLQPDEPEVGGHLGMVENFCRAIREGEELIAPGEEGLYSLELANAMALSSELGRPVSLPLDRGAYDELYQRRVAASAKVR